VPFNVNIAPDVVTTWHCMYLQQLMIAVSYVHNVENVVRVVIGTVSSRSRLRHKIACSLEQVYRMGHL